MVCRAGVGRRQVHGHRMGVFRPKAALVCGGGLWQDARCLWYFPGIIIRQPFRNFPDHVKQIYLRKRIDKPPRNHHIANKEGQRCHNPKYQVCAGLSPPFLPYQMICRKSREQKNQRRGRLSADRKIPVCRAASGGRFCQSDVCLLSGKYFR